MNGIWKIEVSRSQERWIFFLSADNIRKGPTVSSCQGGAVSSAVCGAETVHPVDLSGVGPWTTLFRLQKETTASVKFYNSP